MKYMIAPALLCLTLAATDARAEIAVSSYSLTYNAADGSLTLDTFGGPLFEYVILSTGTGGVDDGFIEANHVLIPFPTVDILNQSTSLDDELSQSTFDGWSGLGPQNLGNVLAPGLSESAFNAKIDAANSQYVTALGNQTFFLFDINYEVPEPGSIVILGIGTALLAQRRRNRV